MKMKVESGLPGYDAWKTRTPWDDESDMISKDEFFEVTRDGSYDEEFLKYVEENDPENLEKIKAGIADAGTAIGSAIDQDLYSWKEIAEEVFDWTAVEAYPGDNDPDPRDYRDIDESFDYQAYTKKGWLLKESNEDHILFNRVEELVKELADSNGIVDLRPANLDLTWIDEEDDNANEIGAYLLSLGKDGKIYVSTGPEDNPMSGDDVTLEQYCSLLQENGAIAHDVDVMLDAIVEALEILKEGETELNEAENFNNEKYPKAEAWLEEHPDIKYFNEVPEQFLQYDINTEDDPDQENIETAVTEAGYMFISELEAALEGGMDDEYLESCAMSGVINDPTYNPPIDSWDYRIR